MKKNKTHRILITITICLFLCITGLIVFGYIKNLDEFSIASIILDIIIILWFGTFPISFYSCWRIASEEEDKYNGIVSHMIYSIRGNALELVYIVPLLFSPFFILQYIRLFKNDYITNKRIMKNFK